MMDLLIPSDFELATTATIHPTTTTTTSHATLPHIYSTYYSNLASLVLVALILSIIVVVMVLGNLLVIISLIRFKNLRTVSNSLIGNLAASDFLLAVTVLPFSSVNECLGRWVFGRVMCNFWLVADVLYCTASIWNICVIALDRYTATLFPLWYRERRSNKQAYMYVGAIWLIAVVTCTPPLFGWNDLSKNYVKQPITEEEETNNNTSANDILANLTCVNIDCNNDRQQIDFKANNISGSDMKEEETIETYACILFDTPSYVIYSASVSFYIPFLLTVLLYIQIFIVLRKRLKSMREKNSKRKIRTATTGFVSKNTDVDVEGLFTKPTIKNSTLIDGSIDVKINEKQNKNNKKQSKLKIETILASSSTDEQGGDESCHKNDELCKHQKHTPLFATKPQQSLQQTNTNKQQNNQQQNVQMLLISEHPQIELDRQQEEKFEEKLSLLDPTKENILLDVQSSSSSTSVKPLINSDQVLVDINNSNANSCTNVHKIANNNNNNINKNNSKTENLNNSPAAVYFLQPQNSQNQKLNATSWNMKTRRPTELKLLPSSGKTTSINRNIDKRLRTDRREIKATVRMAVVIATFCIMWLGFFTLYLIEGICKSCVIPRTLNAFVFWLGYTNSAINPILYAIFNDEFRKAFKKVLGIKNSQRIRR